jgi:hypothetical protein
MFFYNEEPEKDMPHERVSESITLIHPPYDYAVLEEWLHLGNWHAILPGNQNFRPFNTFKTKVSIIERKMTEASIKLIIDSFHDDIEWNVIEVT